MSAPVQIGVADPLGAQTPVYADPAAAPFTLPVRRVQLTRAFAQWHPPGWPAAPDQTGGPAASLSYPRTIASGTIITCFACVAAGLIAANAATPD